jgi:hypothetical protein
VYKADFVAMQYDFVAVHKNSFPCPETAQFPQRILFARASTLLLLRANALLLQRE